MKPTVKDSRPTGRVGLFVIVIATLIAAGLYATSTTSTSASLDHETWNPLSQKQDATRPQLIYFTADWCPPCKALKAEVLSKPEVTTQLQQKADLIVADLTAQSPEQLRIVEQRANQYGVQAIPTILIVDPRGAVIARHTGYAPRDEFLNWFNDSLTRTDKMTVSNTQTPED